MSYGYPQYGAPQYGAPELQPMMGGGGGRNKKGESAEEQVGRWRLEAFTSVMRCIMTGELSWEKQALMDKLQKELDIPPHMTDDIRQKLMMDPNVGRIREALKARAQGQPMPPQMQPMMPVQMPMHPPPMQKEPAPKKSRMEPARPMPAPKAKPAPVAPPPAMPQRTGSGTGRKKGDLSRSKNPGLMGLMPPSQNVNDMIAKRVRRWWPEEGGWFEALITDYRPHTGEHCLTYDFNKPEESYEWVVLDGMAKSEVQYINAPKFNPVLKPMGGAVNGAAPLPQRAAFNPHFAEELIAKAKAATEQRKLDEIRRQKEQEEKRIMAELALLGPGPADSTDDDDEDEELSDDDEFQH